MNGWLLFISAYAASATIMGGLWLAFRRGMNPAYVDVAWTFGVGICGALFAWTAEGFFPRKVVVALIIGLWALRLGIHLIARVSHEKEDGRYTKMMSTWGANASIRMLGFYQLQALLVVLFALPAWMAASHGIMAWKVTDTIALIVFFVAISGEALADSQLARFKADLQNKCRVCDSGLWRYSRHPNYFFEWIHWWCYPLLAFGSSTFFFSLLAPFLMLYFLLKVTGIPATEEQSLKSRGKAYREYQMRTSPFFPWRPRQTCIVRSPSIGEKM